MEVLEKADLWKTRNKEKLFPIEIDTNVFYFNPFVHRTLDLYRNLRISTVLSDSHRTLGIHKYSLDSQDLDCTLWYSQSQESAISPLLTVHIIQKDAPGFRQPIQVIQDPPRMSAEEGIPFDRYRHLFIIENARPYLEIQFSLLCAGHVS